MSELWDTFCGKLTVAGYTLKDLEFCSDDLFLTIAEELNTFSPLQISSLLTHWHRLKRAREPQGPHPTKTQATRQTRPSGTPLATGGATRQEPAGATVKPAPAYPTASVRQAAQRLLQRVCGNSSPSLVAQDVIGIEAPLSDWLAFHECLAQQKNRPEKTSSDPISLLWKLCSPETLAKIERACALSRSLTLSNEDDTDTLCESGIVLYDGSLATTLGSNAVTPALIQRRLGQEGWALVAFDVACGRGRPVSPEEVANLRHFSMAQCAEMLTEAGYDSLSVTSVGAAVVCNGTQLVPRNVVYVGVDLDTGNTESKTNPLRRGVTPALNTSNSVIGHSRRLDYSMAGADDGEGVPSSTNIRDAPRATILARPAPQQQPPEASNASTALTTVTSVTAAAAVPVDSDALLVTKCEIHPRKEVEFWCPTEKRLLCSHCLYYDGYTRENCLPIEVAARQEVPRLERWVGNATTFTKEVQGVLQLFADAKADIGRQEEKVSKDIARQFAHLRERLNALEADMLHEVHDQSRTRQQDVDAALHDVDDTVEKVSALLVEVEGPMKLYRSSGSAAGLATCVRLLRGVQHAFADWPSVDIAPYSVMQPLDSFLADAEAALSRVPKVTSGPGKVELPEAVDVNFLRTDAA